MAWTTPKGFNFRTTLAYVTDGANEQWVGGDNSSEVYDYPTVKTIGGESVTFGWTAGSTASMRDRNSGNDRRLAGLCLFDAGALSFRVDLPAAGDYKIRIALGDPDNASSEDATIKDDTTVIHTLSDASVAANSFLDATNVELTQANWPGSNARQTETFSTTIFVLTMVGAFGTRLAHLELEQVVSGGGLRLAGRGWRLAGRGGLATGA